jgi:hypothetical protein
VDDDSAAGVGRGRWGTSPCRLLWTATPTQKRNGVGMLEAAYTCIRICSGNAAVTRTF